MTAKYKTCSALKVVLLFISLSGLFPANLSGDEGSKYLDAVREFADNVLKYGRDTYGPKHTPLFVDGLNVNTHEPVKWIDPDGTKWILSNLASQQNLFRTLDGLSKVTGDPKYRQAAMEAIDYAFKNLRSPNGLLYWGGHEAHDVITDKPRGRDIHEFKGFFPYYEIMWEVDPNATKQFIEAFWSAHILDWSNLDMNRHSDFGEFLEKPWDHEYKGGPVFFESVKPWGRSFLCTGTDLVYAATWLVKLSGEKEPFPWAERLAYRYVETRHPNTGISYHIYGRLPPLHLESYDSVMRKLDPGATGFPTRGFPSAIQLNPIARPCCSGYFTSTPGITVHGEVFSWLSLLMVGKMLGSEGDKFNQWALEALTAFGKASYRKRDNVYVPTLTEGTNLEGYVVKEDGPLGPKGVILEPLPVGLSDFWTYILAFCVTGDDYMWEMAQGIALGNELGDIGTTLEAKPKLNSQAHCSDPYALLGFVELYKKTGNNAFLQMARGIGDNLLSSRFNKGFFTASNKHIYAKFDAIDSLALLHLHLALGQKAPKIPEVWPSMPFFEDSYRKKDIITDNQLFYTLTETTEPPVSLQEAAAAGDVKLIRSLIEEGFNIDGREDSFYKTALHRAAIGGHTDVVEIFLAKGANINAQDLGRLTPLNCAVENGHKAVAQLLISKGANINARNATGATPMDIAIGRNHREIVELLVASGAEVNIQVAAYIGDLDKVKGFVEDGISVNAKSENGFTPLHTAVLGNQKDVIEFLIANGADVNTKGGLGYTPLYTAIWNKNKDMAEFLIAKGADVNAKSKSSFTPLYEALWNEDKDMVRLLVDKGADVNYALDNDYPPLAYAIWNDDKEMAELFVAHGAKLEVKDHRRWTALRNAADSGNRKLVEFFVSKGADVSGFHGAACVGDLARVKGFVEQGTDIDAKDEMGWTPLYWAACTAREEVAEYLIGKGARVDVKTNEQSTPLHQAALSGSTKLVESFISKGAGVNAKDNKGHTPLWYAQSRGNADVVDLLRKHGSKE